MSEQRTIDDFLSELKVCDLSEDDQEALMLLFLEELGWGKLLIKNWSVVAWGYDLEDSEPKKVSIIELFVRVIDCTCTPKAGTSRESIKAVLLFITSKMESHITMATGESK